jgi:hypothetical protein
MLISENISYSYRIGPERPRLHLTWRIPLAGDSARIPHEE